MCYTHTTYRVMGAVKECFTTTHWVTAAVKVCVVHTPHTGWWELSRNVLHPHHTQGDRSCQGMCCTHTTHRVTRAVNVCVTRTTHSDCFPLSDCPFVSRYHQYKVCSVQGSQCTRYMVYNVLSVQGADGAKCTM